jgi:hypothetical protein
MKLVPPPKLLTRGRAEGCSQARQFAKFSVRLGNPLATSETKPIPEVRSLGYSGLAKLPGPTDPA